MAKQGTILVVDDNKGILTAVQMLLGTCFEKVITISTPNKIKTTLHNENVDVVLLDMNFSAGINTGNEGLFWLSEIKKEDPSVQVVLFTAYADIDLAVRGIKEEEVSETIESNVFGSILHKVMEELYMPLCGKMVTADLLKAIKKDTPVLTGAIARAFAEIFFMSDVCPL